MTKMESVLNASLEGLCAQELAGAYRALCAMMIAQTAFTFRKRRCSRKDVAMERKAAERWLKEKCGTLTFAECCEALDVDCDRIRGALESIACRAASEPINEAGKGEGNDSFPNAYRRCGRRGWA